MDVLEQADDLIRRGKAAEAARLLAELNPKTLSGEELAHAAQLLWRADRAAVGLAWLNPLVRPGPKKPRRASSAQKAEYAMCLIKLGAFREGTALLETLPSSPTIDLYRAFALIHQWNYREAVPWLRRYLKSPGLTRYQKIVARINLASALNFERDLPRADFLLRTLRKECQQPEHRLALGVVYEQSAIHFIQSGDYVAAQKFLAEARNLLADSASTSAFLVRKWQAILDFRRQKGDPKSRAALAEVRAEAITRGHWETVRDCDRHTCLVSRDRDLFCRLWVGTPYPSFRERQLADWGEPCAVPTQYEWRLSGEPEAGSPLERVEIAPGGIFKTGSLVFRVFRALSSDFYRPFRSATLHEAIYPGDYFHPTGGPHRVRSALHRFRKACEKLGYPLEVREVSGEYRLASPIPVALVVAQGLPPAKESARLEKVRREMRQKLFSIQAAAKSLDLTPRSAARILSSAIQNGEIVRTGKGKATRYRFVA